MGDGDVHLLDAYERGVPILLLGIVGGSARTTAAVALATLVPLLSIRIREKTLTLIPLLIPQIVSQNFAQKMKSTPNREYTDRFSTTFLRILEIIPYWCKI